MNRRSKLVVSLCAFACGFAASGTAHAYCRTKACDTDPSYGDVWDEAPQPDQCVRNAQGCFVQGTPLYWPKTCLSFGVQRDGSSSSGIDYATAHAIIAEAFDKWLAADCDGEGPSFAIVDKAEIECGHAEYNQNAANANVFLFRDNDWPYANAIDTLALTTITYNVETAEIYDADVEMNSHETTFTTSDDPLEVISDFASVVTHEAGHFLGLSHSEISTSVMRGVGYIQGSTDMRNLTSDDVAGVCEMFPPGHAPTGSCEPRHGFSTKCGADQEKDEGCSVGRVGRSSDARLFGTLALAALAFATRRVRRPR